MDAFFTQPAGAHPPMKPAHEIYGAATVPIDPALRDDALPQYSDDDDADEWEYEYSTTETETYYVTLDLAVPELEIKQPHAFSTTAPQSNRTWRNPLNQTLVHINDKKINNIAIDSDDDDDDDDPDFVPAPPEIGDMPEMMVPDSHKAQAPVYPSACPPGKGKGKAVCENGEDSHRQNSDDNETAQAEKAPSRPQGAHAQVQVLAFHEPTFVIRYAGKSYVGRWTEVHGSDMVFAKNTDGERYPILRSLPDGIDLVSVSSARIMATQVEFEPKSHNDVDGAKKDQQEEDSNDEHFDFNEDKVRWAEEERRLKWLQDFQKIKQNMGEADTVPLVLLPPKEEGLWNKDGKLKKTRKLIRGYNVGIEGDGGEDADSSDDDDEEKEEEEEEEEEEENDKGEVQATSLSAQPVAGPVFIDEQQNRDQDEKDEDEESDYDDFEDEDDDEDDEGSGYDEGDDEDKGRVYSEEYSEDYESEGWQEELD